MMSASFSGERATSEFLSLNDHRSTLKITSGNGLLEAASLDTWGCIVLCTCLIYGNVDLFLPLPPSLSPSPLTLPPSLCPSLLPLSLFLCSRIPISKNYIEMVIGRLRSDDIYNQVCYLHCSCSHVCSVIFILVLPPPLPSDHCLP